jgi:ABC-type branched-subunit amino acid transport system permease subunit
MAFYGIVLIVVVMVIPQGIVVTVKNLLKTKATRKVEEERR